MFETIADQVAEQGWTVTPDFLPPALVALLREECRSLAAAGEFRAAGIGTGAQRQTRADVRADQILWLEESGASVPQRQCLARLEQLRLTLNRTLQLGLFEFEAHFARYAPGAFYQRHLDQFRGDSRRRLSCVLYLNENWKAEDGGQLRLYLDAAVEGTRFEDVLPSGGNLVVFRSERFSHEVLPARRERLSLSGWFKVR